MKFYWISIKHLPRKLCEMVCTHANPRPPRGVRGPEAKLENEGLVSVTEASRRGRKQRNLVELNLETLLEYCRLLLLGGSMNTSQEAINKNFDISSGFWYYYFEPKALEQTTPSVPSSVRPCASQP